MIRTVDQFYRHRKNLNPDALYPDGFFKEKVNHSVDHHEMASQCLHLGDLRLLQGDSEGAYAFYERAFYLSKAAR